MLLKCVTVSPISNEKITDNCKFLPDRVTTKMSKKYQRDLFLLCAPKSLQKLQYCECTILQIIQTIDISNCPTAQQM